MTQPGDGWPVAYEAGDPDDCLTHRLYIDGRPIQPKDGRCAACESRKFMNQLVEEFA